MILALLVALAHGGQLSHARVRDGEQLRLEVSWRAADHRERSVQFALDAQLVDRDLARPRRFPGGEASAHALLAVEQWAQGQHVQVRAEVRPRGGVVVTVAAETTERAEALAEDAQRVQLGAREEFLALRRYRRLPDGRLAPDHVRIASEAVEDVRPLAMSLGPTRRSDREYAEVALGFVQTLPYERGSFGRDRGFQAPLAVLARNRGDCDSKATLYLSLLLGAKPDLGVAMVLMEGHAVVAVDLAPGPEDASIEIEGRRWSLAEAVGPGEMVVGRVSRATRQRMRGWVEVLRVR